MTRWTSLSLLVLSALCLQAMSVRADSVRPVWTSPVAWPNAVAANPGDGSVWLDGYAGVVHLSADGLLLTVTPVGGEESISVNPVDGSCWVADSANLRVVHLSESGDLLSETFGFSGPSSVAVNPADGSCWVADPGSNQVFHLSAEGGVLWRGCLSNNALPRAVAVNSTDGSCWVIGTLTVAHLAADGTELFATTDYFPRDAIFSISVNETDGSCWVANSDDYFGYGLVVHYSADGEELWRSTLDICRGPTSVSVDSGDGSCWVAEGPVAIHLTADGEELSRTPTLTPGGWLNPQPAVSANPTDHSCWFVGRSRITHLASDGTILWEGGGFLMPQSVSVNTVDGSCWVGDYGFTGMGEIAHLSAAGDDLWRGADFLHPTSVSADSGDGSCWVADSGHGQIVRLGPDGSELVRVDGFAGATCVSADPRDHSCWVADTNNSRIVHLAADGTEVWSGTGFDRPSSVSANSADGSCWVADTDNNRVVHLAADGTEMWAGEGLAQPTSVSANSADGSCWAAIYHEVVHLSASGVELSRTSARCDAFVSVNFADGSCWGSGYGSGLMHFSSDGALLSETALPMGERSACPDPRDGTCWVAGHPGEGGLSLVMRMEATPGPTADFWALTTAGVVPLNVSFKDDSLGNPTSWEWDFGDGGASAQDSPLHTYTTTGTFTVSLSITAHDGSSTTTKSDYITVNPVPPVPVADFSAAPTTGVAPLIVAFTDLSGNEPASWHWDYGDGEATTVPSPSRSYIAVGAYTVSLTVTNVAGSDTLTKPDYITVTFPDAQSDHWACGEILSCVEAGIVAGYPDGSYQPTLPVTRDQMAVYISRGLADGDGNVPEFTGTPSFPDVDEAHWALDYVEYAVEQNVVAGYADGTYHPDDEVTRDQMAVYVARALVAPTGEAALADYVPADPRNFPDVASDFWAHTHIEYCVEHGVVQGYEDGYYHPEIVVTRDQMAVYVARAFGLTT